MMQTFKIYVDDVRKCPNGYDAYCQSTNETLHLINRKYKEGVRHFYLDLDHDAGDYVKYGGDYINILKTLDNLQHSGKYKDCIFYIFVHSMNVVGRENMIAYTQGYGFFLAGNSNGAIHKNLD